MLSNVSHKIQIVKVIMNYFRNKKASGMTRRLSNRGADRWLDVCQGHTEGEKSLNLSRSLYPLIIELIHSLHTAYLVSISVGQQDGFQPVVVGKRLGSS